MQFNKVILGGHLTRDPELRYTPNGKALAKFGIGINNSWKDEGGAIHESVVFVDIDAWGKRAEVIAQHFKKGKPILLEGSLKLDQWEDKNTHQKMSKLRVTLDSFSFVEKASTSGAAAPAGQPAAQGGPRVLPPGTPSQFEGEPPTGPEEDSDVPF